MPNKTKIWISRDIRLRLKKTLTAKRFLVRIRLFFNELLLSDVLIVPLVLCDTVDGVVGADIVFRADSLIEWFANPWLAITSFDRITLPVSFSCDRHDTECGRSEFRRFERNVTCCIDPITSLFSLSSVFNGSAELLCAMTSVEVHCEFEPPCCRHVAIESDGPSDESESRATESDSVWTSSGCNETRKMVKSLHITCRVFAGCFAIGTNLRQR